MAMGMKQKHIIVMRMEMEWKWNTRGKIGREWGMMALSSPSGANANANGHQSAWIYVFPCQKWEQNDGKSPLLGGENGMAIEWKKTKSQGTMGNSKGRKERVQLEVLFRPLMAFWPQGISFCCSF
jgi:hypothetical protein